MSNFSHKSRASRASVTFAFLLAAGSSGVDAQSRWELMRDPEDGALDLSAWLATAGGFLPVVSPVTEPAVGYGGALALAFFHRPEGWDIEEARRDFEAGERLAMPSASGALGMYTSNDSWMVGGGHLGVWGGGRWRYTGGAGYARFNLEVAGDASDGTERLYRYQLEGWGLTQSLRYRLGESDFLVGALYTYVDMETTFQQEALEDIPRAAQASLGSAGLAVTYDSRNATFTTDRGLFANLEGRRYDEALGGDFGYWAGKVTLLGFLQPVSSVVLGLRAEAGSVGAGAPFWARPAVKLRGLARGRYTGDRSLTLESEVRWDLLGRWSVVGFGGGGWNEAATGTRGETRFMSAGGVGFRYLVARAFGLRGGLDFAYGRDGFAFYLTLGSAWPTF